MIKIGVIGCGYWGPQHARNFNDIPDTELAWISDLRPERLQHMQTLYPRVCVTTDYRQILESDVDGVVIATSVGSHYWLGRVALEAGKHVLMEKPLAATVAEATDLVQIAQEKRRTLLVGHTFLYNPAVTALCKIIQSGELGDIYYINATRASLGLYQPDVNVLWDLAPHDISILNHILGATPARVSAHGGIYIQPQRGIHDVAYVSLTYPEQIMAQVRLSWLDPVKVRRYTIVGSRKMLVYDDIAHAKLVIYDKGVDALPYSDTYEEFQLSYRHGSEQAYPVFWSEPLRNECLDFAQAIREGATPVSDGKVGLQVVQILESANRSLLNDGQPEIIDL
jgi:predicted dehydrogenase